MHGYPAPFKVPCGKTLHVQWRSGANPNDGSDPGLGWELEVLGEGCESATPMRLCGRWPTDYTRPLLHRAMWSTSAEVAAHRANTSSHAPLYADQPDTSAFGYEADGLYGAMCRGSDCEYVYGSGASGNMGQGGVKADEPSLCQCSDGEGGVTAAAAVRVDKRHGPSCSTCEAPRAALDHGPSCSTLSRKQLNAFSDGKERECCLTDANCGGCSPAGSCYCDQVTSACKKVERRSLSAPIT